MRGHVLRFLGGQRYRIARLLVRVGKRFYREAPLSPDTRWRLTRIFFTLAAPLLRSTPIWNSYAKEKAWRDRQPAIPSSDSEFGIDWAPAPGSPQRVDFVVWGAIDWEFRVQRPQHLARALARLGHRVFYLSPQFIDSAEDAFAAEQVDPQSPIYSIRLHAKGRPILHQAPFSVSEAAQLTGGLSRCLRWAKIEEAVSIVHQPSWFQLAREVPNARLVYDCIDDHSAFPDAGAHIGSSEQMLLSQADLVTASAESLYRRCLAHNRSAALIPNAAEAQFFEKAVASTAFGSKGRKVLGYYGAVAEWMDVELLRATAESFPDCLIVLIGADTAGVSNALRDLDNVLSVPEVGYEDLPPLLHAMDVCLIPFLSTPLTSAINPVKLYEYLAAARPIVSTDLPELRSAEIDPLVYRAASRQEFLEQIRIALLESPDDPIRERRRAFARANAWPVRAAAFLEALATISEALVSIVIVVRDNLELTKRCIASIRDDESYGNYEIIVIDNASGDGTAEYLRSLCQEEARSRALENRDNEGFAAGVNAGLALSRGEYLVVLNNDTVVTRGWLRTLSRHLRTDPQIGLLGPISNAVDNEARVHVSYRAIEAMPDQAFHLTRARLGEVFEIEALSFFCVMMRREVYEKIGNLDPNYGLGYFEDDDYCQRVREVGLRVCCARDVFVHHEKAASFAALPEATRRELFERNRAYFESKWGPWRPHEHAGSG